MQQPSPLDHPERTLESDTETQANPAAGSSDTAQPSGHLTKQRGSAFKSSNAFAGNASSNHDITLPKSPLGFPTVQMSLRKSKSQELPQMSGLQQRPNLVDLLKKTGGPHVTRTALDVDENDEYEDDSLSEPDIKVGPGENIIPTFEGFQQHILRLNPGLDKTNEYLVDRIAYQMIIRYKNLQDLKIKHLKAANTGSCVCGSLCIAQGGSAAPLPAHSDSFVENSINVEDFPSGIPIPPTSSLPAELECQLCYTRRKLQKPSDWTRHVHDDILPFTCTWAGCRDPKIFKRKADWVRHENEGHRHLEWWTCDIEDCHHICYRRDNFLQHLIREHKFPEPKVKTKAAVKRSGGDPIWEKVERCHQETRSRPQDEPCRFCGKAFSSWKKLTVHLAKHMEHICLPVIGIVENIDLKDPVIGSVEPPPWHFTPFDPSSLAKLTPQTNTGESEKISSVSSISHRSAGPSGSSAVPDSTVPTSVTGVHSVSHTEECAYQSSRPIDGDIESVVSDDDDISSQASMETTYEDRSGKALLGLFLVEEPATRELLEEAHSRMDKPRLVQSLRRLLKSLCKNISLDADTESQRATSRLLRSRQGRLRISGQIVDRIQQESEGLRYDQEMVHRAQKVDVEKWLSRAESMSGVEQPTEDNGLSSDSTESESDTGTEADFPLIGNYKTWLRQSKAFLSLQRDLMLLFLPNDLRNVLFTVPNKEIWISQKQDVSMVNQAKAWVEDKTHLRWDWWPLTPRKRLLLEGEARMFWKCSCGTTLWQEISNEQCRWVDGIISLPDTFPQKESPCVIRKAARSHGTNLGSIFRSLNRTMASTPNSTAGQRYTPTSTGNVLTVHNPSAFSTATLNKGKGVQGVAGVPSSQQRPTDSHHKVQQSLHPLPPIRSWVLLGVDGATRTVLPTQISIEEWTTDYHFFKELKKVYLDQRGWFRSWFSIWQLQYCEIVKFNRLSHNCMAREYSDLPTQQDYKYTPRVPHAKNPPVSRHLFETLFYYTCDLRCGRLLPHNCVQPPTGTTILTRIPKRDRSFAADMTVEVWGLSTVHDPSFTYLVAYHCFMLLGPFLFFILWLTVYPNDLQNASVPASIVAALLSLFWSSSGILTHGKGN